MKTLRLGTRKSALAQAQANGVAHTLQKAFPNIHVEIVHILTSGDQSLSPLAGEVNLKALFTKEIEEALLDKRIDLAVHSLKDMAAHLPPGLLIGAIPEREDPRDVWISKTKTPFAKISPNARIGTGAVRRQAQLKHHLPQAEMIAIRGNVDTRLKKLTEGDLDGIILALAGLKRLGLEKHVTDILSTEILTPAVGQGCLGIQIRERDAEILPYMKALDHAPSHAAALCERAFMKTLSGSCQTPMAGHATLSAGELTLRGLVISLDGKQLISAKENGRPFDAEGIGVRLAEKLLEAGAEKILKPLS